MRPLVLVLGAALFSGAAALRAAPQPSRADTANLAQVQTELRALVGELNDALQRRDRDALERLYAEEYIWVHGNGYVNDLKTHLDEELAVEPAVPIVLTFAAPEELRVYGDVAVLRRPFKAAGMHAGRSALSTWVFAKRDGRWRIVQQQATLLQPERVIVPMATALLDAYAGDYGEGGRVTTQIRRDGDTLVLRGVPLRHPPRTMRPVSHTTFFDKLGTAYEFERAADGRVTALLVRAPDGRVLRRERLR